MTRRSLFAMIAAYFAPKPSLDQQYRELMFGKVAPEIGYQFWRGRSPFVTVQLSEGVAALMAYRSPFFRYVQAKGAVQPGDPVYWDGNA